MLVDRRAGYDPPVRRPARLPLVALGLAAVVYGTASLTGVSMGTPPWWERRAHAPVDEIPMPPGFYHSPTSWIERQPGRE